MCVRALQLVAKPSHHSSQAEDKPHSHYLAKYHTRCAPQLQKLKSRSAAADQRWRQSDCERRGLRYSAEVHLVGQNHTSINIKLPRKISQIWPVTDATIETEGQNQCLCVSVSTVCDLETRCLRKEKQIPAGGGVSVGTSSWEKKCAHVCVFLFVYACVLKEEKQQNKRMKWNWKVLLISPITDLSEVTFDEASTQLLSLVRLSQTQRWIKNIGFHTIMGADSRLWQSYCECLQTKDSNLKLIRHSLLRTCIPSLIY